jgi:hypothetical protein
MKKCNRLLLITITHYDYPMSGQKPGMDRNYCLIVFIVYYVIQWYTESCKMLCTWKQIDVKKKGGWAIRGTIESCPQVHVIWHIKISDGARVTLFNKGLASCDVNQIFFKFCGLWFMLCHVTYNTISAISWRPVLLVEETGLSGEM